MLKANWTIQCYLVYIHHHILSSLTQVSEQKDYVVHYAQTPLEEEDKAKGLADLSVSLVTSHAGEVR